MSKSKFNEQDILNLLDEETARFVEEFTKNEDREPTEDEIAKFRENAYGDVVMLIKESEANDHNRATF